MSRPRVWIPLLLVVVAIGSYVAIKGKGGKAEKWRTMPAERGTVAMTVSATGTIEPVTKVAVGSQVSGTIAWLGAD